MKLQDFLNTNIKYDVNAIASDPELTRQIQMRMIELNLLEPPADGRFGPISTAALRRFQSLMQCEEPGFLGAITAKKMIKTQSQEIAVPPPVLKIIFNTVLKAKPISLSELSQQEKQEVKGGQSFELLSFELVRNHVRVTLRKDSFNNSKIWYAFGQHIEVYEKTRLVYPKAKPASVKLDVPYQSQLDNLFNPTGSGNVTSLAMCLQFLGAPRQRDSGQFEDELYEYTETKGLNRQNPYDLAQVVAAYGCHDHFKENATIEEVQDWLSEGKPAVIHGFFTAFGHLIAIVGYDNEGFYVHDPYGEWSPEGYRTDGSGAYLHYSYQVIRTVCIPDGSFWVHFISK